MVWWTSGCGRIQVNITRAQASQGHHQGQCDADVAALRTVPAIRRQLARIDADTLRAELSEWGAWDAAELADHDANLARLLWLACGDIVDGNG